jgi:hypothetical protein
MVVILVRAWFTSSSISCRFLCLALLWFFLYHNTSYICPPSLILAEAVPENEGDRPCTSHSTNHSLKTVNQTVLCAV